MDRRDEPGGDDRRDTGPADLGPVRGEPPPARRGGPDPLGKRALFWAQPAPVQAPRPGASGDDPAGGASAAGKHALFSGARPTDSEPAGDPAENPLAGRGPITVECQQCGATSRIGYLDFLIYSLPIGVWLPRRKYDRRMTCPSCRRRAWVSATLRQPAAERLRLP